MLTVASRCAIEREAMEELRKIALHARDRERCGVLRGSTREPGTIHVASIAELANERRVHGAFRIDPGALVAADLAARARGEQLLGFFHTHPESAPRPSRLDHAGAWHDALVCIATSRGARVFLPNADGFVELDCTEVSA